MTTILELASDLADRYSPAVEVPPPALLDQVRRNVALRTSMLAEFGAVTAEELADLVGSGAVRRRTVVDNWVRADRVVSVSWRGQTLVPGFQLLSDAHPDPACHAALRILRTQGAQAWERALWWALPAPRLDQQRPVDLLLTARETGADPVVTGSTLQTAADRPRDWF